MTRESNLDGDRVLKRRNEHSKKNELALLLQKIKFLFRGLGQNQ